jgi:hypothetical protein
MASLKIVLVAAALVAGPLAAPADAAPPGDYGFAYSQVATPGGTYAPDPTRQWVSSGGVATVTQTGTGAYSVTFPGIGGTGGIAHVSAVNRTGEWCQVRSYGPVGTNERVDLLCFRPGGAPADTRFSVLYSSGAGVPAYAHVRATAAGTVATSVNSAGAANSVTPAGTGFYSVFLSAVGLGAGSPAGGLQVTATASTPGRCKVATWSSTANGQQVVVGCVNPAGAPANLGWTLSYQFTRSIVSSATPPTRFAYVFDTLGAVPPGAWYNSAGGGFGLATAGVGLRQVQFPAVGASPDHTQVTAYGRGPEYCTTASPATLSGGTVTLQYVVCYTNAGTYVTQPSLVTYTSRF